MLQRTIKSGLEGTSERMLHRSIKSQERRGSYLEVTGQT